MARHHDISFITTLAELEAMERASGDDDPRARTAEQDARERRLAVEQREAERRRRWAEEDRQRAERREREQHEARLRALHAATLERARLDSDARFERDRLALEYAHRLHMAELSHSLAVRRLRSALVALALFSLLLLAVATVLVVEAARIEAGALRGPSERGAAAP